jgi:sensor histidine kinase YesM
MALRFKKYFDTGNFISRVLLHLLFWLIVVTYFAWGFGFKNYKISFLNAAFYLPGFMLVSYSLIYFLIPRYLIKKKYWLFFAGLIIVLLACRVYTWLAQVTITANAALEGLTMLTGKSILPFIHVGAITISIKLLKYWYQQKQQTMQAEQQKVTAELQLLKSQVHPHFLFNTLNNLYSLTLTKSDTAPVVVTHLADLLRYMLYECNEKEILLSKEITVLKKYVELEKLRYGDRIDLSFSYSGNTGELLIAPLLLLPFVENSFKHGVSEQLDQCWINIHLHAEQGQLIFNLSNSFSREKSATMIGGIGLQNIKKRLELIYTEKYMLDITAAEEMYSVKLRVQLTTIETTFSVAGDAAEIKPAISL